MTTYKDLCSNCSKATICKFWLELLTQENKEITSLFQHTSISTIRIVYACENYEKPRTATVIGTGYKPYINKDKHEPETMSEMVYDKDSQKLGQGAHHRKLESTS